MDSDNKSIVKIVLNKDYKLVQEKKEKDNTPRYNRIAIAKGNNMDLLDLMNELPNYQTSFSFADTHGAGYASSHSIAQRLQIGTFHESNQVVAP